MTANGAGYSVCNIYTILRQYHWRDNSMSHAILTGRRRRSSCRGSGRHGNKPCVCIIFSACRDTIFWLYLVPPGNTSWKILPPKVREKTHITQSKPLTGESWTVKVVPCRCGCPEPCWRIVVYIMHIIAKNINFGRCQYIALHYWWWLFEGLKTK